VKQIFTLIATLLPAHLTALHAAEAPTKGDGVVRLTNVSEPTLAVFRASSATAPAPTVIICPGGGYQILAVDKEGTEVAAWLKTIQVLP
jgi:acetyl esterase/lipase